MNIILVAEVFGNCYHLFKLIQPKESIDKWDYSIETVKRGTS